MKITHNNKDTYFTEKGVNYFTADREIGKKWFYVELWSKKIIGDELMKEVSELSDELYLMVGQRHENVVRDIGRYGEK